MRLAMLAPRLNVQGPLPKHTPMLVEGLEELGCEVVLLPWGRREEGESLVVKVLGRPRDVWAARRAVVDGRFPVVVVKTAHDWNTLTRDLALTWSLPRDRTVVVQFHGSQSTRLVEPGSRAFKWATNALLRRVDGVLVLSQDERSEWLAFRPQTDVHVVRNVRPELVELTESSSDSSRAGPPEILCVSRLLEAKGVLDLVRALPAVLRSQRCRVVFVGDGEERERLLALSAELGVADSVELAGYLQGKNLAIRYAAASVLALPTAHPEGLPTVLLEAMGAGLPIVTTPSRGAGDYLIEGENALFVQPRDPDALAASLVRLLGDHELRSRMASANRRRAGIFDKEPVAREYLDTVRKIHDGA